MHSASAHRRITRLASLTAVHRAFHWLHLHQPQLRQWQMEMVRIPAPSFAEGPRAAWFLDRFQQLGLTNVHLDAAGNALAELCPETTDSTGPATPYLLLSAHLDTVFPAGTSCEPVEEDTRISAPGICDNAAGLTALLAIAAALRYARIAPPIPILFAANVGEEGEGDLRGMRHLFEQAPYGAHGGQPARIAAAIALEGSGSNTVVTRGLGSVRLRVTISASGGHSWSDAGSPNPILLLCRALTHISLLELPSEPRTTLNIGQISGGTSVNSIPETASALLDIRSIDPAQLLTTELAVRQLLDVSVTTSNQQNKVHIPSKLHVETIGNRPAAALPDHSPLIETVRAVDRHLALRTEPRIGSTDANLPLSLSLPAIALGAGGSGGGIHTLGEWYDPTGRETALRRILLTVLDTAHILNPMNNLAHHANGTSTHAPSTP